MSLSQLLFSFEGRIRRSTFWYYMAGLVVVGIVARLLDGSLASRLAGNNSSGYGCFTVFYVLLLVLSFAAVGAKRYHDQDIPGSRMWLALIPVVGTLWVIYELGWRPGTPGANIYGPEPKGRAQA